jgi:hypothetical protein
MTLFHHYQNAVRHLARESDELFLFDFQLLVRMTCKGRSHLCALFSTNRYTSYLQLIDLPLDRYLRDSHHPSPLYLSSFLDIMFQSALSWLRTCELAACQLAA